MNGIKIISGTIEKFLEWLPIILKTFKPFNPEVSKFIINYKNQKAKLYYKLEIPPTSFRKRIGKIFIPRLPAYNIEEFFGEGFSDLKNLINYSTIDNAYIIKTKSLPECKNFLIVLKGDLKLRALDHLVRIQPAINKDSTETHDKYWLDVMIRDIETLENIYKSLEVNEINCNVEVAVKRYFSTELPSSLKDGINALNAFLSAAMGSDRNKLFRTWLRYRRSARDLNKEEVENYFKNLVEKFYLKDYLKVDSPFIISDIGTHKIQEIIPLSFNVEAITNLSLKKPAASGYLEFNKENYQKKIREELKEKWG